MNRILLTFFMAICLGFAAKAEDYYKAQRAGWLQKAEQFKPALVSTDKYPLSVVNIVEDKGAYQGWRSEYSAPIETLYQKSMRAQSGVVVDFGEHITGYVTFSLKAINRTPDAPLRLKLTFGEIPSEIATPFDPYPGTLSRAWLQDETITVMIVPATIKIERRLSFRYVKIEVVAAPNYDFAIADLTCQSSTSAITKPQPLPATVSPEIRAIDSIALITLRECMQTVFEDGPKRDQRLWVGDLYLESKGNNYSFKQYDLTKRCLYLFAALADENGYLISAVFENPEPHPQAKQFLLEYSLLFNASLKDYLEATADMTTAQDLWPVARKQIDIVRTYLKSDGLMDYDRAGREWWIFVDWKEGLHKEVALQGVSIFALKQTYDLAKLLGRESEVADVPAMIKKMTAASQKYLYDKQTGLFVAPNNKQVSYASQVWMVLSGVATRAQAQRALLALATAEDVCRPGTPYLYHYYIQSLVDAGLGELAKSTMTDYWGGMINKGADTFWEAYDPQNDFITPYNFYPINSYCHAWSCTPMYFIRKYPEIFQ